MSGPITIVEVEDAAGFRRFLDLSKTIYRDDPHWVPPLRRELHKLIDRRHGAFFDHGEACFWLAWRDGVPVGRISAQINRLHLDIHKDATGNFGFLEAIDDPAVFAALLTTAENWLRQRGMARILGPYSLSINDDIGVLVEGFETPPVLGMAHSRPYYGPRLAAAGYVKAEDAYALTMDVNGPKVARLQPVKARLQADPRFNVRPIDMSRFDAEMRRAIEIYNDAWSGNWGFVPVTEKEVRGLIDSVKLIIRPAYVRFGEIDGRMEAIFIILPNLNEAIADLDGRLFPFGWAKLLWRLKMRRFNSGRVVLNGVSKAHQGSRESAALISWMAADAIAAARADGIAWLEQSWVLEHNKPALTLCRHTGGQHYKTYRIYEKALG